ncbi:hypothetical protein SLE2022_309450 [Rubroshorea leprosula]
MSSLPLDLSTGILCLLSVKDVLRFRCVSKPWCSLIDSPGIRKLLLSSPNLFAIFQDEKSNLIELLHLEVSSILPPPEIIPVQPHHNTDCIVGSCDGLVALRNKENIITLWNPFTRESRKLPQSNMKSLECDSVSIAYGFGYDTATEDYKVLKSAHFDYYEDLHHPTFSSKAEIYSLKTNSWKEIDGCPFRCGWSGDDPGILAENALHWLIQTYDTEPVSIPMHRKIVGFDLVGEVFYEVPIPDCFYRAFSMTVAALDGRLCIAASYKNGCVNVWVMEEYGVKESWNKAISMTQEKVPRRCRRSKIDKFQVFPLAYSRGGDKLLVKRRGKLFWYDLESEVAELDDGQGVLVDADVNILTASLVMLEDRSEINGKTKQIVEEDENSMNNKKRYWYCI